MRSPLAGLLAGFVLASPAAVLAAAPFSVPFTVTPQHLLTIRVALGKEGMQPVVLDTGGGVDVLSLRLVHELGGTPAGTFTGFRLTGERLDLPLFTIPEIRLGPAVQKNALVAAWDGLDKLHLAGVLSLSFFRDHPFTLDIREHRLILESPASLRARRTLGSAVSLRADDLRGISLDIFAPLTLDGHPALCEVDTGSQGYIFARRYMDMLGLTADSAGVKSSEAPTILGHQESRYSAPVRSLRMPGTQLSAPATASVLFEDLIYDCDVGIDFFQGRSITFDIAGRQMIVSRR